MNFFTQLLAGKQLNTIRFNAEHTICYITFANGELLVVEASGKLSVTAQGASEPNGPLGQGLSHEDSNTPSQEHIHHLG